MTLSIKAIHFKKSIFNDGKRCPIAKAINSVIDNNRYSCREGLQFAVIIDNDNSRQRVLHHAPYNFEMYLIDMACANCSDSDNRTIRTIEIKNLENYCQ